MYMCAPTGFEFKYIFMYLYFELILRTNIVTDERKERWVKLFNFIPVLAWFGRRFNSFKNHRLWMQNCSEHFLNLLSNQARA